MAHVRQQIREAIGTACTGLSTTGARVYQARVEVEVALMDNATVQNLVANLFISETSISFANEGDRPIGCASMSWSCVYYTEANDPQTSKS